MSGVFLSHIGLLAFAIAAVFFYTNSRSWQQVGDLLFRIGTGFYGIGIVALLAALLSFFWSRDNNGFFLSVPLLLAIVCAGAQRRLGDTIFLSLSSLLLTVALTLFLVYCTRSTTRFSLAHTNLTMLAHLLSAVIGEIFAFVAATAAACYLLQAKLLKEKKLQRALANSLPALDQLELLLTRSLALGFFFFTTAVVNGSIYTSFGPSNQLLTLKLTWSLGVWATYLLAMVMKTFFHISTKGLSRFALVGFFFLGSTYFGFIFG